MKKLLIIASSLCVLFSCKEKEKSVNLVTNNDKISYAIGLNVSQSFKQGKLDTIVNNEAFIKGFKDGMTNNPNPLMHEDSAMNYLEIFSRKMEERQHAEEMKIYEKNIDLGKAFLDKNKTKDGVVTLPSGLQYKVLKKGNGKTPKVTDTVTVHYKGSLINGEVFQSSYDRKEPVTFPVTGVIKGWTEALLMMREGDKWEVYIPQDLAYGEYPRPGSGIEPYSTLIFEIELLSVGKKKK
ncbi:MAG: FKBP-type peptidyl-prolyl cis-trans isomerase [Bacteroidales bacterium]